MAKRLTITGKWTEPWFMKLSPQAKLIFIYILDNCDFIGIYEYNEELLRVQIGFSDKVNVRDHIKELEEKVEWFNDGVKIWVVNFIKVQYGVLKDKSSIHKSVIRELKKYGGENKNFGQKFLCFLQSVNQFFTSGDSENTVPYGYGNGNGHKNKIELEVNSITERSSSMRAKKNFCQFPNEKNLEIKLPELSKNTAKQFYKLTKQKDLTDEEIESFWKIFKVQHFTGKKFYADVGEVYSHFLNWIKTQNISQNGSTQKHTNSNSKTAGVLSLLQDIRKQTSG